MTDLTIVHSSDLHIDVGAATDAFHPLCRVLAAARRAQAQLLLLAGDIFDNNRLPLSLLDSSARLLADAGMPVVILPGNHDCLTADSVYRRGGISDVPNVHVIGVSDTESCLFPEFGLEVWRRALPPDTLHTTSTSWEVDDKTLTELYLIWHLTGVLDMIKTLDESLHMILVDVMEEKLEEAGYSLS